MASALIDYALTALARVKFFLGISGTDYDTLLEQLINAVTDWMESQCGGRRFKETEYTQDLYDGNRQTHLILRNWPVASVSSAQYKGGSLSNPTWTDFTANDWDLLRKDRGMIYFPGGVPKGIENIRITYTAGYKIDFNNEQDPAKHTLPFDLELVVKQLVSGIYDQRKAVGKKSEAVEGARIDWGKIVTAEMKEVILKYRKINL